MSVEPEVLTESTIAPQAHVAAGLDRAAVFQRGGKLSEAATELERAMATARATPYEIEFQTRIRLGMTLSDVYLSLGQVQEARDLLVDEVAFAQRISEIMQATGTPAQKRAATSGVSDELLALRLPPGAGIAGLVFSTTQPMAVADVSNEGSFWSEADRRTGFKTVTVLATPLQTNGEMVGVLEFINRPGDPPYPPFTPAEMDSGSRFADAIARLVDAYEIAQLVESLFNYSIKASMSTTSLANRESDLRDWLARAPAAAEHRDLLMLWVSLREIVTRGGAERTFCRELLEMIARFTRGQSGDGSSFGF